MKSVLISIQPKKCHYITIGRQTIIVNKTKPKLTTPFKCYIYQTKSKDNAIYKQYKVNDIRSGKVIGEFICDKIDEFQGEFWDNETHERIDKVIHKKDWDGYDEIETHYVAEDGEENYLCKNSCLTWEDLRKYIGQGINFFYGWHISNLVIYDKPKELSEFKNTKGEPITRAFQSWGYVEEV